MKVLENLPLLSAFVAWLIAQTAKVLLALFSVRQQALSRFTQAGGMPSSHTALVVGLAASLGWNPGLASAEFAVALVLALIVMYDAAGVRRAVGSQAEVLNRLVQVISTGGEHPHQPLSELLGHTPREVFAGAVLGIAVAWFMNSCL